jgi:multicomponent Na+:H+ antiporter subunit E
VLILVFLKELIKSALVVAREVLRPTLRIRPGVIAYPLDVQTGREITTLANLISLTPGTLSIDVSDDRRVLYIHAFLVQSEEATEVRDQIKETLEKHVARALGPLDEEQQSEIHSA